MRILQTETFRAWFAGQRDATVRGAVLARIGRLRLGNPGDAAPVGEGVSELRIHVGAGWRLYFIRRGAEVVILLCGGSKRTQARDIAEAKRLAASGLKDLEA